MPSVQIPLTQGRFAIVDDRDAEVVLGHKWFAKKSGRTFYAVTTIRGKSVSMHRLLLSVSESIDHKNRDGLDNRRENIRPCTKSENSANKECLTGNSGYRGVRKRNQRWAAQIKVKGVKYHLGTYDTPEEAAFWYDLSAISAFGEFAVLNGE